MDADNNGNVWFMFQTLFAVIPYGMYDCNFFVVMSAVYEEEIYVSFAHVKCFFMVFNNF